MNNYNFLAIIPARKDSKGIKNKNRVIFFGKPLIHWTIVESLKCKFLDKIIISTDDQKILSMSKQYKDPRLFFEKRPKSLTKDNSLIMSTIKMSINQNSNFKNIILLQPDSPLRKVFHINKSINNFINSNALSCVSVTKTKKPPELFYKINKKGFIKKEFLKNRISKNKQDFDFYYEINGAIYISKVSEFLKNISFLSDKTSTYEMQRKYSIDIDNSFDLELAKFFFSLNNKLQ